MTRTWYAPRVSTVSRKLSPFLVELALPLTLVVSMPRFLAARSKLDWVRVEDSKKAFTWERPLANESFAVWPFLKARARSKRSRKVLGRKLVYGGEVEKENIAATAYRYQFLFVPLRHQGKV